MPLLCQPNANGLLRAITNIGLINKSLKIYSFKLSFGWNVQYCSVCINRLPANDLLFFYDSYIRKLPHRLLASHIRRRNNSDLWCHAACHGYVTIRNPLYHLENRYSQFTWNEFTSLKCFSPQFTHLILAGFILPNPIILSIKHFFKKKKKG